MLVDRPVDVPPDTADLDVGLVHEPPITRRALADPGGVAQQRRESLHLPQHGDVIDLDAAFSEQPLDVPVGQPGAQYQRTATTITSVGKRNSGERRPRKRPGTRPSNLRHWSSLP